jgi:hypothetical protein
MPPRFNLTGSAWAHEVQFTNSPDGNNIQPELRARVLAVFTHSSRLSSSPARGPHGSPSSQNSYHFLLHTAYFAVTAFKHVLLPCVPSCNITH